MIKILLFCVFLSASSFTFAARAKQAPHDSYCAKINLSAIYGAEKSYYAEYANYADTFKDIGFEQTDPKCNDWQLDIRPSSNGQAFLATAKHPDGQEWSMNESKQLLNVHEAN